jgi:hypothetical protein
MTKYKLSNEAKKDLIRIHRYGIKRFGVNQADNHFNAPLSELEVTLRNKIDESFKEHFSDDLWLHNVLPPVMGKQMTDLEQKLVSHFGSIASPENVGLNAERNLKNFIIGTKKNYLN